MKLSLWKLNTDNLSGSKKQQVLKVFSCQCNRFEQLCVCINTHIYLWFPKLHQHYWEKVGLKSAASFGNPLQKMSHCDSQQASISQINYRRYKRSNCLNWLSTFKWFQSNQNEIYLPLQNAFFSVKSSPLLYR
jgi:hypothetical protein